MKLARFAQALFICSTVATLALTACGAPVSEDQSATPTGDLQATVEAAVEATVAAQPTDTPAPEVEATKETDVQATVESAVQSTVEVAIQSTVEVAIQSTLAAMPTSLPPLTAEEAQVLQRLHRSYPAPTGYPGFRKYYQKRCYPGCHDDGTSGTPTPQVAHP
jgi:hypothetical protein